MVLDSLTGLYNQRFADERLPLEMAHAQQQSYPLTVVMFES